MPQKEPKLKYESSHAPTWCPGCGNFAIWTALKRSFAARGIPPHKILMVYGIGCAGNMSNTLATYGFHALHGRAVPVALGAKLVNKDLTVVIAGGDGDGYGEGLNHLIHGIKTNIDVTYIVHNNSVYGLTTGQASPTSPKGFKGKSTPEGSIEDPLHPLALAISAGATFVARGFAGNLTHLEQIMARALAHPGFALVDIFQPCVTFNKTNTYEFYRDTIRNVDDDPQYQATDRLKALEVVLATDKLGVGVLYQNLTKLKYSDELSYLGSRSLISTAPTHRDVKKLYKEFQ